MRRSLCRAVAFIVGDAMSSSRCAGPMASAATAAAGRMGGAALAARGASSSASTSAPIRSGGNLWTDGAGWRHWPDGGPAPQRLARSPAARRRLATTATAAVVAAAASVAVADAGFGETVPYTGRRRVVLLSSSLERRLGAAMLAQTLASNPVLPEHHPATRLVRRIGHRLAEAAGRGDGEGGGSQSHMRDTEWGFWVVDDPRQANAFVLPGERESRAFLLTLPPSLSLSLPSLPLAAPQVKAIDSILVDMHGGATSLARVLVATMIDASDARQVHVASARS